MTNIKDIVKQALAETASVKKSSPNKLALENVPLRSLIPLKVKGKAYRGSVEIAKGKRKQSTRQMFLSSLMKIISGDSGENIIRQWSEGRFEKFTGSMIKVAKMMVEHSPKAEKASAEDTSSSDHIPEEDSAPEMLDNKDAVLVAQEYIRSLSPEEVTEFIAMCNSQKAT